MNGDSDKLQLNAEDLAEAQSAHEAAADAFLSPESIPPNVVGVGVGGKWSNGEPTGEPALVVFVSQKVAAEELTDAQLVPSQLGGMQTDVLAVGELFAGDMMPEVTTQSLARRIRPAEGGYSVGHKDITAGTIATAVYDILPGGSSTLPRHGVGVPRRYYILSNNHVLANSNAASLGDPILQPGPVDGGSDPADRIARLSRFVPITFAPAVPLARHRNLVDAAVAEGNFHDLDREIYWVGYVRGWRRRSQIRPGMVVQKTGRTTNFTTGRVVAINAVVNVNYSGGRVARFLDQVVTTPLSAGGDSGSLVTTPDNVAVGLLFAGSSQATIVNYIEHVRRLLRVEVAEEVL